VLDRVLELTDIPGPRAFHQRAQCRLGQPSERDAIVPARFLDKVLGEQNFSNSNRADPSSAAKIGKVLGVSAIIIGSITI